MESISFTEVVDHLLHLLGAYVLALPIGWDREMRSKSAGLRTFPLIAMAACGFMLVGLYTLDDPNAHSRIIYGIATGIGFLGGGAILKGEGTVSGTTTAASIWNTAAIGVAVAWQRYEIAIALSLLNFITLRVVQWLKHKADIDEHDDR